MNLKYIFWTGIIGWLMLAGCKKDEIVDFGGGAQVYFDREDVSVADSMTYSFAVRSAGLEFDTVEIGIVVSGDKVPYEREVKMVVVEGQTTAKEGVDGDYVLTRTVIAPNEFKAILKVRVNRREVLKREQHSLVLMLQPTGELGTDVNPRWLDYKLKINDILTMPARWVYECLPYFGEYSQEKYRFIIEKLGVWEFPDSGKHAVPKAQMLFYQDKMKTELAKWEKENGGPKVDENGNVIKF